jgi:hypothetical protein
MEVGRNGSDFPVCSVQPHCQSFTILAHNLRPVYALQPECDELIHEARNVNYIDEAEYPSSTQIQNKCGRHPSVMPS